MFEGTFPLLVSIIVLGGILYLAYTASRYIGLSAARQSSAKHIRLLDTLSLGSERAILVVKIGERQLLLGVTSGGIVNLAELAEKDVQELLVEQKPEAHPKFAEMMSRLGKRK